MNNMQNDKKTDFSECGSHLIGERVVGFNEPLFRDVRGVLVRILFPIYSPCYVIVDDNDGKEKRAFNIVEEKEYDEELERGK